MCRDLHLRKRGELLERTRTPVDVDETHMGGYGFCCALAVDAVQAGRLQPAATSSSRGPGTARAEDEGARAWPRIRLSVGSSTASNGNSAASNTTFYLLKGQETAQAEDDGGGLNQVSKQLDLETWNLTVLYYSLLLNCSLE